MRCRLDTPTVVGAPWVLGAGYFGFAVPEDDENVLETDDEPLEVEMGGVPSASVTVSDGT